jgi:2-keto-4-pentenoate hydratase/2-oxohepta-3-ene-1,7-dioic acid hydratase in catechol pathway
MKYGELMKIKKLKIGEGKDGMSLAVLHDGRWIVLKKLLEQFRKDKSAEFEIISGSSGDLITFLQSYDATKEKLHLLLDNADTSTCSQTPGMKEIMPFVPLFYRDFMLSEQHVINSTRGFVRQTMPALFHMIKAYEKIFRKPFPALRPAKAWYDNPVYYKGNFLSFKGCGESVSFPQYATLKDYELELGMIITKDLFNASEEEGLSAIGGFCIFNDFSARNVQVDEMKKTGFGPCKSKDFASSISNVVATPDEVLPFLDRLKTRVFINDVLIAEGRLNGFHHSLGKAVAYASKGERVFAGEFMGSGTIPDCCGMENGRLLNCGDVIRLEIDNIGELTNTIGKDQI